MASRRILQALSEIQIKTGDYPFTTLRPVPALTRIKGVLVQLVEIPGLIGGASDDRGGGRALLGVLRSADAIVFCARAGYPPDELQTVRDELTTADIDKPAILAITRADEATDAEVDRLRAAFPDLEVVPVSILDPGLARQRCATQIWRLTGLIRVYLRTNNQTDEYPLPCRLKRRSPTSPIGYTASSAPASRGARVWGPSARFEGQRVGREHVVQDTDTVEILR